MRTSRLWTGWKGWSTAMLKAVKPTASRAETEAAATCRLRRVGESGDARAIWSNQRRHEVQD